MGKGYAVRHVEMKAELLHKTIPKGNYEIHCFGKLELANAWNVLSTDGVDKKPRDGEQ